jgi:hypothetical protein
MKVIPSGSSVVVSEKDRHHEGSRHPDRWDLSTEMQRDFAAQASQAERNFASTQVHLDAGFTAGALASGLTDAKVGETKFELAEVSERGARAGALASSKTDQLVDTQSAHTRERLDHSFAGVHGSIGHQGERRDDQYASVSSRIDSGFAEASVLAANNANLANVQAATLSAQASVQATTYFNAGSVAAQNNASLASVQAERVRSELGMLTATGFQSASTQAERIAAASSLEATKYADAALLRAEQLASIAAAKAAECCCELKTAILASEHRVIDRVDATERRALERSNAGLLSAYNSLYAAKTAPVAPITPGV